MGERVLVTGASGFVAGHCVVELLDHGYEVRASVRPGRAGALGVLRGQLGDRAAGLEEVEVDLLDDAGWAGAVAGCDVVWHVASPAPKVEPEDPDEILRPAVEGTERVLRAAAAAGVRRVVVTSSIDAVRSGRPPAGPEAPFTEEDWSDVAGCAPYARSKTLAEQAAWALADELGLELVTILPGLVLGPPIGEVNVSAEVIRLLLSRQLPLVPPLGFAIVDARDVAAAHRLATEVGAAAGNRYIVAGDHLWFRDIAVLLRERYGRHGVKVPTRPMPIWLMRLVARFDRTVRLAVPLAGVPVHVSSEKARRELGWKGRPAIESLHATADRLIELGVT